MLENIIKDCFWDYDFTLEQIIKIAKTEDFRMKKFLFEKILLNSHDMIRSLKILFTQEDLIKLVDSFKVPEFNFKYIKHRYLIAKYFITGEKVNIPELEWKI
ncbi:MAG: hypothetical protein U9P79_03950 [Candidatus Cloacimonadota bacterium]|nr:hypothetical protein [Candidatus Cloacimonadota bacterium]